MSKLCKILSHPIKEYERRKTLKIYNEIVSNPPEAEITRVYFD